MGSHVFLAGISVIEVRKYYLKVGWWPGGQRISIRSAPKYEVVNK